MASGHGCSLPCGTAAAVLLVLPRVLESLRKDHCASRGLIRAAVIVRLVGVRAEPGVARDWDRERSGG